MGKLAACILVAGAAALAVAAPPASADVVWLCRPGLVDDPCQIPQDTTIESYDAPAQVVTPPPAERLDVDCFYVYPTVSNQPTPNASKSRDPELASIANYQAARFNRSCRIFAPIYRQATLAAIAGAGVLVPDRELAYADVLEAWREYLARDSQGRGFVLLGHSQGSIILRRLIREEIDGDEELRRRMIGAYVPGTNVLVAAGQATGGDFKNVPVCTEPAQVGCVVAFSTFAEDPPADSRYGRTSEPGKAVACTDPRALARVEDPLRLLVPSEPYAPGLIFFGTVVTAEGPPPSAPTTWVVPPDRGEGTCRDIGGAHVLRHEPIPPGRRPHWFPEDTWGTHLIDVNLLLEPMLALVAQQTRRWLRPELALVARCRSRGRRLELRLDGRDTALARAVDFKAGKRRLARDDAEPFRRSVRRPSRRRALRAVVQLVHGASERVVLSGRFPRC